MVASSRTYESPAVSHGYVRYLFVVLIAAFAAALHLWVPLNHDVAWILEGAQALLRGAEFGRDVIDANPPLAWWIACIPAALDNVTGCGLQVASVLFTIMFGIVGLVLSDAALKNSSMPQVQRDWLIPCLAVFLLVTPGYDFGQREHFMLMSAMTYVAAASTRAENQKLSRSIAIAIGLFSAMGFCLKPYFLFVPLFVEAWLVVERRSIFVLITPEFLTIPLFGAAYMAAVFLFAPVYLSIVMPESQAIYWAYNIPLPYVLKSLIIYLLPVLVGCLLVAVAERKMPPIFVRAAVVAAFGASLSAIIQHKGFSYHLVPAFGLLAAGCIAFWLKSVRPVLRFVVIGLVVFFASLPALRQICDAERPDGTFARVHALDRAFRDYAGKNGWVYAFITSPRDIHPAIVASHTRWSSRACCIYHLPAQIRAAERPFSERESIRLAATHELDQILDDLTQKHPRIVAVDAAPLKLAFARISFDYIAYLSRSSRFRQFWSHYSERQRIGDFRIFVRTS